MGKFFVFCNLIFIFLMSCSESTKKYNLMLTDSFTLDIKSKYDPYKLIVTYFERNDSDYLAYISDVDSTITILNITPGNIKQEKVSLKNIFNDSVYSFPTSICLSKDTFILWHNNIPAVIYMSKNGKILKKYLFRTLNEKDHIASNSNIPVLYRNNKFYTNVLTFDKSYRSYVYPYCDRVYEKTEDSVFFTGVSGQYPSKYIVDYIHLNHFFRINLDSNIIYGFQASDSIFKFDLNGTCVKKGKIASEYNNGFLMFDEHNHGNIPYIIEFCTRTEENLMFGYSKKNDLIYCVKRLGRNKVTEEERQVIICIDKNLNTKYEIQLHNLLIPNGLFFIKNEYFYLINYGKSKVIRYRIDEK